MSRTGSRKLLVVSVILALVALGTAVALVARRPSSKPSEDSTRGESEGHGEGAIRLALALPQGSGPALTSVAFVVQSSRKVVIARGVIPVADPKAATLSQDVVLPVGQGDIVTFIGNATASNINRTYYLGRKTFDVVPGQTTEVPFAASPPTAGRGAASDVTVAAAAGTNDPGTVSNASACESCQLSSSKPLCDPPNLTATSNTNPQTGEETGVGWGCGTLPTAAGQAACSALLHCLSVNNCERQGQNPVLGCYCGDAQSTSCIAGQGITGVCIAQYHAAAMASADGPAAGATVPELARFIATSASNPTTPLGLADNIRICASESSCDICSSL